MAGTEEKTKRRKTPSSKSSVQKSSSRVSVENFSAAVKTFASDKTLPLPASPWITLSSDSYRVRQFVRWLGEQLLSPNQPPTVYFGGDLSQSEVQRNILQSLSVPSLFEPRGLYVIYSVDAVKPTVLEPILAAAARSAHASLLLSFTDEKKVPDSEGTRITFEDLKGQALQRWIERELKRNGCEATLEPQALEALSGRFEGSLLALSHELQKLALIGKPGQVFTLSELKKLTQLETDADSFSLLQEIARKNVIATTALSKRLLSQGLHPLQIVAFLSRCIRTLIAKRAAVQNVALHPELTNYYFVKNVEPISQLFQSSELTRTLALLSELDLKLKNTALDPETLIEIATVRMATRRYDQSLA